MKVSDVMSTEVTHVTPDMPIRDARALMKREGIHHLAVTRGQNLLGVVSAHDLLRAATRGNPVVADAMVRHVLAVEPATTLARAAQLMRGRSVGCLMVRNRGRLVGIVTTSDLLGHLGNRERFDRATTARAVHHRVGHKHRAVGDGMW